MTRLATARRVSWGFGDQALSSLTNFAVGILVARSVSQEAFGAFSVAFTTYLIVLITSRALASEPFLVRHSGTGHDDWKSAARGSSALALVVGMLGAAFVVVLGLVVGGTTGEAFIALAVVLPGLMAQDMWRFAFIAQGRAKRAFVVDLAWLLMLAPGLAALDLLGSTSVALPIVIWGAAGGITALGAHLATRTAPTMRAAGDWLSRHHDLGVRYVAEALVSLGAIQVSTFAVVALSGLTAAGALRGAQLLLGPTQVLLMGIGITAIPEGVRLMRREGPRRLRRPAVILSLGVSSFALGWGVVMSLLPDPIGSALLGETWPAAHALTMPLAVAFAIASLSLGPGIGLRALADANRSLQARSVDATAQAIGGVVGAAALGALGAALGMALGAVAGVAAHWSLFFRSVRQPPATPPATELDVTAAGSHEVGADG